MGNKRNPGCKDCHCNDGTPSDCPCINDFAGAALDISMPFPDGDAPLLGLTGCEICGPFEPSATCDRCLELSGTYPITWLSPTVCSFCNSSSIWQPFATHCWQYGPDTWPSGTDCSSERRLSLFRAQNNGCFTRPISMTISPSGSDLLVEVIINYSVIKMVLLNCFPEAAYNYYNNFAYRFRQTFADCDSISGIIPFHSVTSADMGNFLPGRTFYDATVTDPCNTESATVEITR